MSSDFQQFSQSQALSSKILEVMGEQKLLKYGYSVKLKTVGQYKFNNIICNIVKGQPGLNPYIVQCSSEIEEWMLENIKVNLRLFLLMSEDDISSQAINKKCFTPLTEWRIYRGRLLQKLNEFLSKHGTNFNNFFTSDDITYLQTLSRSPSSEDTDQATLLQYTIEQEIMKSCSEYKCNPEQVRHILESGFYRGCVYAIGCGQSEQVRVSEGMIVGVVCQFDRDLYIMYIHGTKERSINVGLALRKAGRAVLEAGLNEGHLDWEVDIKNALVPKPIDVNQEKRLEVWQCINKDASQKCFYSKIYTHVTPYFSVEQFGVVYKRIKLDEVFRNVEPLVIGPN